MKKGYLQKIRHWIVPVVFLGMLIGGGVWQSFTPDRDYSVYERRLLQQRPALTVAHILDASYMSDYEAYLTDQFPMRDHWITMKTYAGLLLGQREFGGVYITENDGLIELHRMSEMDDGRIESNTGTLVSFAEEMIGRLGTDHVRVMLVPTADCIKKNKIPDGAGLFDQSAYLQKLHETFAQMSYGGVLVPVEAALMTHAGEAVYYKTDHHWTMLGAYYGYTAYAGEHAKTLDDFSFRVITDCFTGTVAAKCGMYRMKDEIVLAYPKKEQEYLVNHNEGARINNSLYEEDKAYGDDPYAVYLGGNDAIVTVETGCGTGRSLLIVRDSYANCFVPYLTQEYEKITLIDLRYYNGSVTKLVGEGYTDILVLYNLPNFLSDRQVYKLLR